MLIPEENVKDLHEIAENVKNRLEIIPVKWIDRVLEIALERAPVPLPDDDAIAPPAAPVIASDARPDDGTLVKH